MDFDLEAAVEDMCFKKEITVDDLKHWSDSIEFIDPTGSLLHKPYAQPHIVKFLAYAEKECKKAAALKSEEYKRMAKKSTLTPSDIKSIKRWVDAPKPEYLPFYHGLTNRARKFMSGCIRIHAGYELTLKLYQYLAPHTSCFAPYDKDAHHDAVKALLHPLLDDKSYHEEVRGEWLNFAGSLNVYHDDFLEVHMKAYLNRKKKALKIKVMSENQTGSTTRDKLDVELLFNERTFQDVVHYHVEKPNTARILCGHNQQEFDDMPHHIEFSKFYPSENVIIRIRKGNGEPAIISTDNDKLSKDVYASRLWKEEPSVVGGPLLCALIDMVSSDPRFTVLQYMAMKR